MVVWIWSFSSKPNGQHKHYFLEGNCTICPRTCEILSKIETFIFDSNWPILPLFPSQKQMSEPQTSPSTQSKTTQQTPSTTIIHASTIHTPKSGKKQRNSVFTRITPYESVFKCEPSIQWVRCGMPFEKAKKKKVEKHVCSDTEMRNASSAHPQQTVCQTGKKTRTSISWHELFN